MPSPSSAQLHVDRYLTNVALAWSQSQANFVADKVFPMVPVTNESNLYSIYEKGFFYRASEMQPRPLGGRPINTGYEIKQGRYICVERALEHLIDDRVRVNADAPLDPDMAGTRLLMSKSMILRDQLWTSSFFNTGIWGTDWTGVTSSPSGNQFLTWDESSSDPIQFIRARANDILSSTGYRANTIVFGTTAYEAFINHPDVLDRIKYVMKGMVTNELVGQLLDLDKVLVARGVQNSAAEGQSDDIGFIAAPTSVMLCYAAPAPSIVEPSAGYTFAYTGLLPGVNNAFGGVIYRGREDLAHSDVLQVRASYDQRVVAAELGEFFQTVVSPTYSESTF